MRYVSMVGRQLDRLLVIHQEPSDKRGMAMFSCRCVCGMVVVTRGSSLRAGHVKSCGCLRVDIARSYQVTHGHSTSGTPTREYRTWDGMLQRCRNSNAAGYKDYGGRGITVCRSWSKFENFLADMGPKPKGLSIDRVDNDGNYEPANCRWATAKEQRANQRGF